MYSDLKSKLITNQPEHHWSTLSPQHKVTIIYLRYLLYVNKVYGVAYVIRKDIGKWIKEMYGKEDQKVTEGPGENWRGTKDWKI